MDPHPDWAGTKLPRHVVLPSFQLTPLSPEEVEEDYEAVVSSTQELTGLFGTSWPEGLTLEDNRVDLAWHEREFTARRSFAWIVRDKSGQYLGCVYIYPDIGSLGAAKVVAWIRAMQGRDALTATLTREFAAWLMQNAPEGVGFRWAS